MGRRTAVGLGGGPIGAGGSPRLRSCPFVVGLGSGAIGDGEPPLPLPSCPVTFAVVLVAVLLLRRRRMLWTPRRELPRRGGRLQQDQQLLPLYAMVGRSWLSVEPL